MLGLVLLPLVSSHVSAWDYQLTANVTTRDRGEPHKKAVGKALLDIATETITKYRFQFESNLNKD